MLLTFADGEGAEEGSVLLSPSPHTSVRSELLLHPQLWLIEKSSGLLVNRVTEEPVALAHEIAKYAETCDLGSRYGCDGMSGGPVAGKVLPEREEFEGEPWTGVSERGLGIMGRPDEEYWGYVGKRVGGGGDDGVRGWNLSTGGVSVGYDPYGTDNGGMGSTLLCRWRYTPS
jgi:hypothetical protein